MRSAVKLGDMHAGIFRKLLLCSKLAVECNFGQVRINLLLADITKVY